MEEKPMECFACKREGSILYKKVIDGKVVSVKMCSECPLLCSKFSPLSINNSKTGEEIPTLSCSHCHTTFSSLKQGEGLGCPKCYETFEKLITEDLTLNHKIPVTHDPEVLKMKKTSLHLGKTPDFLNPFDMTKKLDSLNNALAEALAIENYEKAADLRDQIKELMDTLDER